MAAITPDSQRPNVLVIGQRTEHLARTVKDRYPRGARVVVSDTPHNAPREQPAKAAWDSLGPAFSVSSFHFYEPSLIGKWALYSLCEQPLVQRQLEDIHFPLPRECLTPFDDLGISQALRPLLKAVAGNPWGGLVQSFLAGLRDLEPDAIRSRGEWLGFVHTRLVLGARVIDEGALFPKRLLVLFGATTHQAESFEERHPEAVRALGRALCAYGLPEPVSDVFHFLAAALYGTKPLRRHACVGLRIESSADRLQSELCCEFADVLHADHPPPIEWLPDELVMSFTHGDMLTLALLRALRAKCTGQPSVRVVGQTPAGEKDSGAAQQTIERLSLDGVQLLVHDEDFTNDRHVVKAGRSASSL